ncbi:hypothetical protein EYF80_061077 [Liparis tanakae]|uniref:Uncharacterized protein n=1 Tax=Liparis tanakae TaxID=230148 RepID=A0A4Z2EJ46_9TELE|nr:hypothetical protein EYF80_061077 [Liparis tanakae]
MPRWKRMWACSTPENGNTWSQNRQGNAPGAPAAPRAPGRRPPGSSGPATGESDRGVWASPGDSPSSCPPFPAEEEEDEEEEEEEEEEEGVLKGVGGGGLGPTPPRDACWELWRGGGVRAEAQAHLIGRRARHLEDLLDVGELRDPGAARRPGFDPRGGGAGRGGAALGVQQEAGLEGLQRQQAHGVPLGEALQGGGGATGRQPAQPQAQAPPPGQVGRGGLLGQAGGRRLHVDHLDAVQVRLVDVVV